MLNLSGAYALSSNWRQNVQKHQNLSFLHQGWLITHKHNLLNLLSFYILQLISSSITTRQEKKWHLETVSGSLLDVESIPKLKVSLRLWWQRPTSIWRFPCDKDWIVVPGGSAAFSSSGVKLSRTCLATLSWWVEEMKEVNATQWRDVPWNDEY